ncbi:lasso peptide biosynthesis B2 protein [Sphingobium scionense]
MEFRIKPGLHFCVVEGRTIFLDEDASRYFCIPDDVDRAFQLVISAEGKPDDGADDTLIADLIALEILEGEHALEGGIDRSPPMIVPTDDLGPPYVYAPPAFEIAAAFYERLRSNRITVRRGVADVRRLIERERLRFRREHSYPLSTSHLAVSAAFEVSDFVFGRNDRCLPRAIAMIRRYLRVGYDPSLVIGVRINPFTAHCWVQQGSTVFGESIDIARYASDSRRSGAEGRDVRLSAAPRGAAYGRAGYRHRPD